MFGPKRDEVTGVWRKLYNENYAIYALHQIILGLLKQGGLNGRGM
jgi:hypothetical protein